VTTAVIGAGLLWSATAGAAAQPVETVTPTGTPMEGNVTICQGDDGPEQNKVDLEGVTILGSQSGGDAESQAGEGTVEDSTLTVTLNPGFTATGIVVKGGIIEPGQPGFNLYTGPFVGPIVIEGLTTPSEQGISHWFVCGMQTTTTTTTAPPTTTTTTRTDTTTVTVTTTSTSLPVTGGSATGLLAAGAAMVAAGGVTLFLLRRRRALTGE
jgi:LPXTG-motif cell wall-anchored protein